MRGPKRNVGGFLPSRMCAGMNGGGNNVAKGEGGLKKIACDTSRTACAVVISTLMCTGLFNACSVNCIGTSLLNSRMNLHFGAKDRYKV